MQLPRQPHIALTTDGHTFPLQAIYGRLLSLRVSRLVHGFADRSQVNRPNSVQARGEPAVVKIYESMTRPKASVLQVYRTKKMDRAESNAAFQICLICFDATIT
jgi:hypothetical protein